MKVNEVLDEIMQQIQQPLWENWYISEQIGSGAFSAVYRIEANRRNRIDASALKIEPIIAGDTLFLDEEKKLRYIQRKRESVENEAAILYKLKDSKHVVSYEDESIRELTIDGKFEGYYFLIRMELLTCLSTLIREKKFDFSEASVLQLAKDIGMGIKAAHDIGIIHRDIKPSNFFVSKDGVYKLGDFNISKESDTAMTFAGTEGYLAPEIYRAKLNVRESYTNQADIYSFGICLYQLMNNLCFPFENDGMNPEAFNKRMQGEAFAPPINASEAFARVIMKACSFTLEERYSTIDAMLEDLQAVPIPETSKNPGEQTEYASQEEIRTTYANEAGDLDRALYEIQEALDKDTEMEPEAFRRILGCIAGIRDGNESAHYALANLCYKRAMECSRKDDAEEADKLRGYVRCILKKPSENGHKKAQYLLAGSFLDGDAADISQYEFWMRESAKNGYVTAQSQLGQWYTEQEDFNESFKWYLMAAENGDMTSQLRVAHCYLYGQGTLKDDREAFEWLQKAAANSAPHIGGREEAMLGLGKCYYHGMGTEKNPEKALACFEKARTYPETEKYLAFCHFYGIGTKEDRKKAWGSYHKLHVEMQQPADYETVLNKAEELYAIGWCLEHNGRAELAEAWLQEAKQAGGEEKTVLRDAASRINLSISGSLVIRMGSSMEQESTRVEHRLEELELLAEQGDKDAQKKLVELLKSVDRKKANFYAQKYQLFYLLI